MLIATSQTRAPNAGENKVKVLQNAGTYKRERIIVGAQSTAIHVEGAQGEILNFCANNYLGTLAS